MVAKLTLKEAVHKAKSFVLDLYQGEQVTDILLEEIQLSSDKREWQVTIGFTPPWMQRGVHAMLGTHPANRVYKQMSVDVETGEVRDLRIRLPGADPR
jgi:hypothetical protein